MPIKKPISDQAAYGSALLAAGLIDKSLLSGNHPTRRARVVGGDFSPA